MPKERIIIQMPITGSSDFDVLLYVEEMLIQMFIKHPIATLDGHHIGDDKFNIFILPKNAVEPVVEQILTVLQSQKNITDVLIVLQVDSGEPAVVWPVGYKADFRV